MAKTTYVRPAVILVIRTVVGFCVCVSLSGCADASGPSRASMKDAAVADADAAQDGSSVEAPKGQPFVYVASGDGSIYIYRLQVSDGSLAPATPAKVSAGQNPSFLAVDPLHRYLFATNETDSFQSSPTGAVAAFRIASATGGLTFVNRVASGGRGPTHVSVDQGGRYVLVANYNEGSVVVIPIGADGSLGTAVDTESYGVGAQSHMVITDAANTSAFVVNKGPSEVRHYAFGGSDGSLTPRATKALALPSGSGSRHIALHPTAPFAYVVGELDDTVTALSYNATTGLLAIIESVSTLPTMMSDAANTAAEIALSPSGRTLYASNRGHDSVAVFGVAPTSGKLTALQDVSTGGSTPRSFAVDPAGRFVLVANQDTNTVVTFSVDANGKLTAINRSVTVSSPGFVGIVYLE